MKNILKAAGIFSLVFMLFAVGTAFTGTTAAGDDDYSCKVTVKYSDGSKAASVKVTTDVSGGISCVGGRDFYTDKNGEVTLNWVKGCYLKKVYVKGTGYKVDYQDGRSYTLTMD
jgi:hypothetical protein